MGNPGSYEYMQGDFGECEMIIRQGKSCGLLLFPAFILLCSALVAGGTAFALDYDWRDPGTEETEAVLSCLRKGNVKALDAIMADGLGIDQTLPLGNHRVPMLSLALSIGSIRVVKHLLDAGADVDTMSSAEMQRMEMVPHSVKVRTR